MSLFSIINISENREEELKKIVENMRKYSQELERIKKNADLEWDECSKYLDDSTNKGIFSIKENNDNKFQKDIQKLEEYATKLDYISNVFRETEVEIKNSTKNFESIFEKFERQVNEITNKSNNNQN